MLNFCAVSAIINYHGILLLFIVYIRIYVHKIMRQGKGVSKPSEAIASFHEMKFAVVARLSEGRSPEFRSHRRMSPWNSNR